MLRFPHIGNCHSHIAAHNTYVTNSWMPNLVYPSNLAMPLYTNLCQQISHGHCLCKNCLATKYIR